MPTSTGSYPDYIDPAFGIPLTLVILAGYAISVIRERRAEVKNRAALRKEGLK